MNGNVLCAECGALPVSHGAERFSAISDKILFPLMAPFEVAARIGLPFFSALGIAKCAPLFFRALAGIGAGTLHQRPDEAVSLRTRCLWESAFARGIHMREFRFFGKKDANVLFASFGGRTRVFDGLPRPNVVPSASLRWMDDKGAMKKKFAAAGFPVARGGVARGEKEALLAFQRLEKPVVVKPNLGSGSRHTHIHLADQEAFLRTFRSARELSPWVVVEEELSGSVFRATLLGGKVVGVIRRDPPRVVGDGRHTVRELVEKENKRPIRGGPIFSKIEIGPAAEAELAWQGLTKKSVPKRGAIVRLHQKINWSVGGSTEDVTDRTHPENWELFEAIGRFLDDPIVGIDCIVRDIARPWREQEKSGVIELNSLPLLDNHHYPFSGVPRDAAGAVWDLVFPESRA